MSMHADITNEERVTSRAASRRMRDRYTFTRGRATSPRPFRWRLVARVDNVYIYRQERNTYGGWKPTGGFHVVRLEDFWAVAS